MPQYLDDNGNPIAAPKQYLDDSGNPISKPSISAAPAPRATPEARSFGNYASEIARGVGRGIVNDVKGIGQLATTPIQQSLHPIRTAQEFAKQAETSADAINKARGESGTPGQRAAGTGLAVLENAPIVGGMVKKAEQGGTQLASPEAAGAAAEGIATVAAPEIAGKARALAPRASRVIPKLVKDATAENAKAVESAASDTAKERAKVDQANAKQEADRAAEIKAHHDKTSAARKADEVKAGVASRKSALESGVNKLSDKFQEDLKTTRDDAAKDANAKYTKLNAALGEKTIESKALMGHLEDAAEKFKGSNTEPTIFKDIKKNVEGSDTISYDDLQGYYSEIGRELTKGNLPGDVYTAYNTLQEAIGGEMQKVADSNGMGPQLTDARTSWRNLKQTFYDPKSPLSKSLKTVEKGDAVSELSGYDRTAIEALAKYNPELAKRGNALRVAQEQAAALHPSTAAPKTPVLSPKKAPLTYPDPQTATIKKIGEEDVQGAKAEKLQKTADSVRKIGYAASSWAPFYAVRQMVAGHSPNLAAMGGEMAGTAALGHGIARILESPAVSKFLTKATARDVAAIPADLRGDFPRIVQQAQKQGIKVSPDLVRAMQVSGLAPRKQEFDVETGTQPSNELMPGGTGDVSALPAPLQRVLESAKIVKGAPTSTYGTPDIATVDEGDSKTITVRDPSRFQPQVLAHEAKHLLDRNLAPGFRAQFPKDDPNNPYMQTKDLLNLPEMRKKGMTLKNLPEEKQAQLNQAWVNYQNDPEMRKILQPWMQDQESFPQSNILPTDANQKGINTTPRAPVPPSSAFEPAPRNATDAWAGQH